MKSFKRIEILVKVLWILSLIVFVLNIIGAAEIETSTPHGYKTMNEAQITFDFAFNGKTIAQMLAEKNVSVNSAYTGLAIGIFNCIVGAFLSYYLYLFFKKHSDRGVVIDKPLVKETRKVSLVYIIVSLSAAVLSGIGIGIATAKATESIARQPEAKGDIRTSLIIGCALAEATAVYGFVIALLIIIMLGSK